MAPDTQPSYTHSDRFSGEAQPDKPKDPAQRVYLLAGEEPFLLQEARASLVARLKGAGFVEHLRLDAERGFDWDTLISALRTRPLFGERRLVELRLPDGAPGQKGARVLIDATQRPVPDAVLLIVAEKLAAKERKNRWYQAVKASGEIITVWPVEAARLPGWIAQRLRATGMRAGLETCRALAERVEGNLSAAAQAIEKLRLLYGEAPLTLAQVMDAVSDDARFSVFSLADGVLLGKPERVVCVLDHLRAEGTEPVLILWSIARTLRELIAAKTTGDLQTIWPAKRRPLLQHATTRHTLDALHTLLKRAARIDRLIKGVEQGSEWDALLQLGLAIAGNTELFDTSSSPPP